MSVGPCTDIGANLLHKQFDADREAVIDRARAAGVTRMLITCTDLQESGRGVEFCRASAHRGWQDELWCTAGVHPHHAKDTEPGWLERLAELVASPEVKALGETGLDFNRNFSPRERQLEVFEAQLELAARLGKPVFVHDRDSQGMVHEVLARHAGSLPGVVVHCFTGTGQDLERYLAAGFYIGITGWVCDERRGQRLRELVTDIPLELLLVETDAPFLLPHDAPQDPGRSRHRHRNEPALLPYVIHRVAQLRGSTPSAIARATHHNAATLFRLP